MFPYLGRRTLQTKEDFMIDEEKREFARWWLWILGLIIVTAVAIGALNYVGIIGKTAVEREVFEESYQYTAGQRQKIATYEAQLAEINSKLSDPNLDDATRKNLEAQKSSIKIQLDTARRAQK